MRVFGNIVEAPPAPLVIGAAVQVTFVSREGFGLMPMFRLVPSGGGERAAPEMRGKTRRRRCAWRWVNGTRLSAGASAGDAGVDDRLPGPAPVAQVRISRWRSRPTGRARMRAQADQLGLLLGGNPRSRRQSDEIRLPVSDPERGYGAVAVTHFESAGQSMRRQRTGPGG